jgi:hypothetical protein
MPLWNWSGLFNTLLLRFEFVSAATRVGGLTPMASSGARWTSCEQSLISDTENVHPLAADAAHPAIVADLGIPQLHFYSATCSIPAP